VSGRDALAAARARRFSVTFGRRLPLIGKDRVFQFRLKSDPADRAGRCAMASRRQDHVMVGAAIAAVAMFVIAAVLIAALQRRRVVSATQPVVCGASERCRPTGAAEALRAEGIRTQPRPVFKVRESARHGVSRKTLRPASTARHTQARPRAQPASQVGSAAGGPQPRPSVVERPSAPPSNATRAGSPPRVLAVSRSGATSGGDGSRRSDGSGGDGRGGDGRGGDGRGGDHGHGGSGGDS